MIATTWAGSRYPTIRRSKKSENTNEEELHYHHPGKLGTDLTTPWETQHQPSLANTPRVAIPCLEIAKDETLSFRHTNRSNLVAVISDGTAVLDALEAHMEDKIAIYTECMTKFPNSAEVFQPKIDEARKTMKLFPLFSVVSFRQ